MTAAPPPDRVPAGPSPVERALHIWVLCAFAFSEPLFAALAQQFVFLHDLEAGWLEIGCTTLILAVGVPAAWLLLDWLVIRGARFWRGRGRDAVFAVLFCLVWLVVLRPFMRLHFLETRSAVWLASLALAIPCGIASARLYRRFAGVRRWVSVASFGLVCFPGLFLYRFGSLNRVQEQPPAVPVKHPVPVVLVVFDEFSGTTLMDRDLRIDAARWPQFARLAQSATWYRQASTVHNRTDFAVPALLSGRFPDARRPPLESEYPGNLFQLVHGSGAFDMTVYEPITRLCPPSLQRRKRVPRSSWRKIQLLTGMLAAVYPRLILPKDTPVDFPPISRLWFGLPEHVEDDLTEETGLRRFAPFQEREDQLQKFLDSLRETSRPQFHFLHVEFPHAPWCFLPSGRQYNYDEIASFEPAGSWGEIGEDWSQESEIIARNEHRYLLQVAYLDHFVGQLLDRLQQIDLFDRCLLIVTADHGVSFRPGHSRRLPDARNLPDLISVPLFVKLPGQSVGQISDDNVESVDLLPTIAAVLGITPTHPVDGISLLEPARRPRKSLYVEDRLIVVEPRIPQLDEAVGRRWALFGTSSLDRPPESCATHPEWHGRKTSQFSVVDKRLRGLEVEMPHRPYSAGHSEFVPCLVWGSLEQQGAPADLVVAVNGVIVDSGTTFQKKFGRQGFEFLLREAAVLRQPCQVELFLVETAAGLPQLCRLAAWNPARPADSR